MSWEDTPDAQHGTLRHFISQVKSPSIETKEKIWIFIVSRRRLCEAVNEARIRATPRLGGDLLLD